jgi:signal transduction histidine kinase
MRFWLGVATAAVVLVLVIALYTARSYAREATARERESYLRRSLDETAKNERFLASLFDAITDVVVVQDTDYKVIRANRVAKKLYGESVVGKACTAVYRGRDDGKRCPGCPVEQVLATGKPVQVEMRDPRTGEVWSIADYPLFDENGAVRMVIEHARNVTQTKRLEAQLVQSEKLSTLGEMAAGVAHEINNPIGVISMYAQLLAEDVREQAPEAFEKVRTIEQHAEHVGGIVKDLLRFSRRSTGEKHPVTAQAVIDRALSVVEHQKSMREVEVVREIPEPSPAVLGDEGSLAQVIVNFVVNASHAMSGKGRITIKAERVGADAPPPHGISAAGDGGRLRPDGALVRISVTDTGKGIAKKHLKRIFEPFFTTKPAGEGTGLGLSVSFVIVRDHGGAIWVDSEEGKGATFTLELPEAPVSEAAPAAVMAPPS